MTRIIKWLNYHFICKKYGHHWNIYTVSTGYYSYDVEQAGYCSRCGADTHGKYFE